MILSSPWRYFVLILGCLPLTLPAQSDPIPGGCVVTGQNLVINPEFELDTMGVINSFNFNEDYTCSYGDFTVANTVNDDPNVVCYNAPGFSLQTIWAVADRKTPGGHFMIVDPCDTAGTACSTTDLSQIVWQQNLPVCPGEDYAFSVFAKNIYYTEAINYPGSDTMPDFEMRINGDTIEGYYIDGVLSLTGSYQLPKQPQADSATWIQISGTWNAGSSTTANLVIRNLVPGSQGNDLAIDGLFFGLCGDNFEVNVQGNLEQCAGLGTIAPVTFSAGPNQPQWLYYELYRNDTLIAGDASGTFTTPLVNGAYYGDYMVKAYRDPNPVGSCGNASSTFSIKEPGICPTAVFPVSWQSFEGNSVGERITLDWETGEEVNNQGFFVEVGQPGEAYQDVGFVPAHASGEYGARYQYVTENLPVGTYVFRLRQVDIDGGFTLSPVIEVTHLPYQRLRTQVRPNPLTPESQLIIEAPHDQWVKIEVLNMAGQQLAKLWEDKLTTGQRLELPLGSLDLGRGVYLIQVSGSKQRQFQKFTVLD
ncbi:MAG: T9SS type A sorting domain-containing protein [Bacteroidota bacterium]